MASTDDARHPKFEAVYEQTFAQYKLQQQLDNFESIDRSSPLYADFKEDIWVRFHIEVDERN